MVVVLNVESRKGSRMMRFFYLRGEKQNMCASNPLTMGKVIIQGQGMNYWSNVLK